ncbi:IS3 family transposase, partial [Escherichia coli]|nr:IS3 family transposase [Escherichia coli]
CYGYRRIHCELQKRGLKFSGKTVRKLMQQLGLKSPVRLKKYRSYRGNMGLAAENILQRQFKAEAPCEKWVTDITEGWHYRIKSYQSALADRGLVQSMSRKGNCLDNAVMEN